MEIKVAAATCMHWSSHPIVPQSPSSQAISSSIPYPSRRTRTDVSLSHSIRGLQRSALFGRAASKLLRSSSCEIPKPRRGTLRRAITSSSSDFSDEEFAEQIRELALRFYIADAEEDRMTNKTTEESEPDSEESISGSGSWNYSSSSSSSSSNDFFHPMKIDSKEPPWLRTRPEPPYEIMPISIERKANSLDLPLSLRILKKKNQWKDDFREVGESAYCSVMKAFSSMVFIIQELHSYTLQMREYLYLEDVHGIVNRVQEEMHASFVWLFQHIFSHTPTLMMYVMILMANFTVHSMSTNAAIAATQPTQYYTEIVSSNEIQNQKKNPMLDSSQSKSFSEISVGGNNGAGGKVKLVGSGTDGGGDGGFNGVSFNLHNIVPDELSQVSSFGNPTTSKEDESVSINEETKLWNSIVEEASKMQATVMDESLDHETMQQFVSPIKAEIEPEDLSAYSKTELNYLQAISQEPNNPLFLSNYAQFLYLVVHDHDRAEEYFKRASQAKPSDAEALSKYANFLWIAKKDITAAEETYLEAIDSAPGNPGHAGNYAHFLWNTGGEDTCYPDGE